MESRKDPYGLTGEIHDIYNQIQGFRELLKINISWKSTF